MKTFLELNTLGVYNVFDMKGKDNHLVVAYLKDKLFIVLKVVSLSIFQLNIQTLAYKHLLKNYMTMLH